MGRAGPAKTPNELKIARGTYRKDRDGSPSETPSPQVLSEAPTPDSLGEHGAAKWSEMFERLSRLGIITETDLDLLELYCRCFDEVAKYDAFIKEHGVSYMSEKGVIHAFPEVAERKWWLEKQMKCAASFGLSPSARASVRVNPDKSKTPVARRERGA